MNISASTQYALVAVGYFASHPDDGIVLAQTIAKEYDIPLEYLLKILQNLVRAGILSSKRGPRGGFNLARDVSKITVLEILQAIDGPSPSQVQLLDNPMPAKFAARMAKVCEKAIAEQNKILGSATVADLVGAAKSHRA
jgi:Rrf2 family protein